MSIETKTIDGITWTASGGPEWRRWEADTVPVTIFERPSNNPYPWYDVFTNFNTEDEESIGTWGILEFAMREVATWEWEALTTN